MRTMTNNEHRRKPIGKRLRFEIFARDNFTCRYCGRQSDTIPLHIDHIIPVCQGGSNDTENLITSCADCNLGKSGKQISQHAPTESDRLRMAQEFNEQAASAKRAQQAIMARVERKQAMIDTWCQITGRNEMDSSTATTVFSYVLEYGEDLVYEWISIAAEIVGHSDTRMGRYISGIRRTINAQEDDQ